MLLSVADGIEQVWISGPQIKLYQEQIETFRLYWNGVIEEELLPFHKFKNDDPRNGLSLCKNHHWMFDYHIIGVDKKYRIRVSMQVVEDSNRVEETMKWDGEMLLLPDDERLWPAVEVLG